MVVGIVVGKVVGIDVGAEGAIVVGTVDEGVICDSVVFEGESLELLSIPEIAAKMMNNPTHATHTITTFPPLERLLKLSTMSIG